MHFPFKSISFDIRTAYEKDARFFPFNHCTIIWQQSAVIQNSVTLFNIL
jgi:hypothetical protein